MFIRYSDRDIEDMVKSNISFFFDEETLSKIKSISEEVGAPEYTHTPQFHKKDKHANYLSDAHWESIRNFKVTKIIKRDGIDGSVDLIRKYLNKMSTNTCDKLTTNIIDEIKKIYVKNNICILNPTEGDCADIIKIGDAIFSIASSSKFYSKMYAKLYSRLISEFSFMKKIFDKNFDEFSEVFHDITYCDPKDYDKYCDNNKKNEKRRALGLFYVNLMIEEIVDYEEIINIITTIQNYLEKILDEEGKKDIADEVAELLYIMVVPSNKYFKNNEKYSVNKLNSDKCNNDKWNNIISIITKISKLDNKDKKSITNKTIFKHLDLIDAINKK